MKRNNTARGIIISRLDAHYHNKISSIKSCKLIIEKLKESKKIEMNVTEATVREELYSIRKGQKEKVDDFNNRFDAIIRKYESCDSGSPLSEVEIGSAYYNAVIDCFP